MLTAGWFANRHHLVSGGSDGSLRLWDIRKNIRGCLRSFDVKPHRHTASALAMHPTTS